MRAFVSFAPADVRVVVVLVFVANAFVPPLAVRPPVTVDCVPSCVLFPPVDVPPPDPPFPPPGFVGPDGFDGFEGLDGLDGLDGFDGLLLFTSVHDTSTGDKPVNVT